MPFVYDAFFSYRHRPLDNEITQKTFNALESYRLPKALREKGFADIRRAFRDTEELPVSRILTDTIDKALHSTNCLIVVCSTDTPESEWIDREVQTFIELGRADHIYPLLITGDPERSFPPSLKLVPDVMDRVMDIRTPGNDIKKMMAREETELLRVIAGITGCGEAELLREHKLRKGRRAAVRAVSTAAVFAAVAGVSLGLMRLAQEYRDEAQRREQASMRILSELTYDLPNHLTNIPGAYSRIGGILEQNTADIEEILRLSAHPEAAAYESAANREKLANASLVLGETGKALAEENAALARFSELQQAGWPPAARALASAYHNRGSIYQKLGRFAEAEADFRQALSYDLGDAPEVRTDRAVWLFDAGCAAMELGKTDAADDFRQSLLLLDSLEESPDQLRYSAMVHYNCGLLHYREGRYPEAEEQLHVSCQLYERLLTTINSRQYRNDYVQAATMLVTVLTDEGDYARADPWYENAIREAEALARDDENLDEKNKLAILYCNRGIFYNIQGDYARADVYYRKAVETQKKLLDKTGSAGHGRLYALYLLNTGENAFKLGDYPRSRAYFEDGLAVYAGFLDALGDYDRSQYHAWLSYYSLIHLRDADAALDAGLEGVRLQPNNVLANLNLAYACLYSGHVEDAENLLTQIAALGGGQAETIRVDLEAQRRAGLDDAHHGEILALIREDA